jgi:hypothetical protein
MRLKLRRQQRSGGMMSKKVIFILNAKADYSGEEQANIKKYGLGSQVIYNSEAARRHLENTARNLGQESAGGFVKGMASLALAKMSLNISIDSLAKGHEVECKDLDELLGAEDAMRTACENLKGYLEVANSFDGREEVLEY